MMILEEKEMDPTLSRIATGAMVLQERAASMRTRLRTRQETLIRLRAELTELNSIIEIALPEAAAELPEAAFMQAPAFLMEPAVVKAVLPKPPVGKRPTAAIAPQARRSLLLTSLPILCLVGAFLVITRFHVTISASRPKMEASATPLPAAAPGDDQSAEALALVRQWRMAGDDQSLFERLGGVVEHPGGVPAWSAEMAEAGVYLVIFREAAGAPIYAFEANLASRTVLPTPEATHQLALIISGRR